MTEQAERVCTAIAIDTCIFDKYHWRLVDKPLVLLENFQENGFPVLVPKIIFDEMCRHYEGKLQEKRTAVEKARDILISYFEYDEDKFSQYETIINDNDYAEDTVRNFLEESNGRILPSDDVKVDELEKLYHDTMPPFEDKKGKKREFPDAIALLTIDKWAKINACTVLIVSVDNGWKLYAEQSERMVLCDDLLKAIEYFQDDNYVEVIRSYILRHGLKHMRIEEAVAGYLEIFLDNIDFHVDAYTNVSNYEWELSGVEIVSIEKEDQGGSVCSVLDIDDDEIVLSAYLHIRYLVAVHFSLYVYDSIDKESLLIDSRTVTQSVEDYITAILTCSWEKTDGPGSIEIQDVDFDGLNTVIDFGEIEFSWQCE